MYALADTKLAMASPKPPAGLLSPTGEEPAASPRRFRILIVEDDTIIAWSLEALLSEMGHEIVDIAATGERALASAAEFEPDLVMMDINLGSGMNGIEAASTIRRRRPTKVVFVSAYGDPEMRDKVRQAVPDAPILSKPVRPEDLKRTLSLIGGSSQ